MTRAEYIKKFTPAAVNSSAGTGLFPSVALAQGAVESGNGDSLLAKKYNNHFGIKAQKGDGWTGKKVNLQTREVVGGKDEMQGAFFRVYNSAEESYRDRAKFLKENPRYTKAGVFTAKTPEEQLKAFQKAGYATDPNYANIIIGVLKKSGLEVLDTLKKNKKSIGLIILSIAFLTTGIILYKKNS
jgi:flagellum-specific peptidoglycan hydrolase FlgJ